MSLDTTNTTPDIPASALPAGQDAAAYVAEMTGKVEAAATGAAPAAPTKQEAASPAARPDYIPEKFWDAATGQARLEDVFKSYTALEQKMGKPADPAPANKADDPAAPTDTATTSTPELGGAIESFITRFNETNGEVTDADIAPLEKLGLPRETINTYMAGLQAIERIAQIDAEETWLAT